MSHVIFWLVRISTTFKVSLREKKSHLNQESVKHAYHLQYGELSNESTIPILKVLACVWPSITNHERDAAKGLITTIPNNLTAITGRKVGCDQEKFVHNQPFIVLINLRVL